MATIGECLFVGRPTILRPPLPTDQKRLAPSSPILLTRQTQRRRVGKYTREEKATKKPRNSTFPISVHAFTALPKKLVPAAAFAKRQ